MHPRCRCTISAVVGKAKKVPAERINIQQFSGKLPEGNYNLTVRRQVQNRHIQGTAEYQQYLEKLSKKDLKPSILFENVVAADLIKEFHKAGIYDPNPKDGSPREIVNAGRIIGQYWDKVENRYVDTTWLEIVYSKHGIHIYPIYHEEGGEL